MILAAGLNADWILAFIGVITLAASTGGGAVRWFNNRRSRNDSERRFKEAVSGVPADPKNGIPGRNGILDMINGHDGTEGRPAVVALKVQLEKATSTARASHEEATKAMTAIGELTDAVERIDSRTEQLEPNSGGSLFDKVKNLSDTVPLLLGRVQALEEAQPK